MHATGYAIPPRTPLVVTLHDLAWRREPSMFTRNGVRFFEAGLRCVIDDADLVLCPSQATLEDCVAAGIGPDRAPPRAVGHDQRADVTDATWPRCGERYGVTGRYVLSVGTLEPRKNLARLVEAFARLAAAATYPRGRRARRVGESRAVAYGGRVGRRLRLTGSSPVAQLGASLRWSGSGVLPEPVGGLRPARGRGHGAGAPVVTSAGTATEELVAGGAGLAVDPLDVDAIAGALAAVLDDDELAARLRAAGTSGGRGHDVGGDRGGDDRRLRGGAGER